MRAHGHLAVADDRGLRLIAPTPRIAACGGLITATNAVDPEHAEVGDGERAARRARAG